MKKVRDNLLKVLASGIFVMAIQAVNVFSQRHCHQDKEPASLKKYEKM